MPCRRGQPVAVSGRVASAVFLPTCPWTSEFVCQPSSLWLRVRETSLGMSGGAGWPGAHLCEAAEILRSRYWILRHGSWS